MKKCLFNLLLLVAFCVPWAVQAQEDELTVAEGTETNSYVPVYGLYCDDFIKTQIIYPADMLEDMVGGTISSMTFYLSSSSSPSPWTSTFQVKLTEVAEESFTSSSWNPATGNDVYSGTLTVDNHEMTIEFTDPYVYGGGNLMFEIYSLTDGNYSSSTWLGITSPGGAISGYSASSVSSISPSTKNFIPMTTFSYTAGGGVTCPKPTDLVLDELSAEGASISWTAGGSEGSWWVLLIHGTDTITDNVSSPSYTFSDLTPVSNYTVKVAADCGGETSRYASLSFSTPCATYSMPFSEDFTNYLPNCWERYSGSLDEFLAGEATLTPTTSGWISSSYVFPHQAKVNVYGTSCKYWLVTPTFAVGDPNPTFAFDLALTDYNSTEAPEEVGDDDRFVVLISADGGLSWQILREWNSDPENEYSYSAISYLGENVTFDLSEYIGQEVKIAFYGESTVSNADNDLRIANVECFFSNGCERLTSPVVNIDGPTSASIAFVDPNDAGSYTVAYGTTNDLNAAEQFQTNENPAVLTDLTANTTYYVWIQANCGGGASNWLSVGSFTTPCDAFEIPFVDGFEEATTGSSNLFDPCWTTYTTGTSHYPYVSSTSGSAYEGSKYLYFSGSTNYYAALPLFNAEFNTLQISFMAKGSSAIAKVGVMSNPSDISTFQEIASFNLTSSYQLYTAYASAYEGNGQYFAIRCGNSSSFYVDSLAVDLKPSCTTPARFSLVDATTTDATISWVETGEASAWQIEYGPAGFSRGEGMSETATEIPYLIYGLDANTLYDVYITPDCAESDDLTLAGSFRTSCEDITLPYAENFDTAVIGQMIPCWSVISEPASYPVKVNSSSSYSDFETPFLYVNGPATIALPKTPDALSQVEISFDLTFESVSSCGPVYMGYAESLGGEVTYFDTINAPAGYAAHSVINYVHSFAASEVSEPAYIIIKREGTNNYLTAFDNFELNIASSCVRPEHPSFTDVTSSSFELSWSDPIEQGNYDVAYNTINDVAAETTVIIESIGDISTIIDGIEASTVYYAWVRANCGGEVSPWVAAGSIRTTCGDITIPYFQNFDSLNINEPVPCWTVISEPPSYPYVVKNTSSYTQFNTQWLHMNGPGAIATPKTPDALSQVEVAFDLTIESVSSCGPLYVGYASTLGGTVTYVDTINAPVGYEVKTPFSYVHSFANSGMDEPAFIIFSRGGSSNYLIAIDNFEINIASSCDRPGAPTFVSHTGSSITVSWTDPNQTGSFDVAYNTIDDVTSEQTQIVSTSDTSYTIDGLAANTVYYIWVRANCGGEYSPWVAGGAFRTDCGALALPYNENFDNATLGQMVPCWTVISEPASYPVRVNNSTTYTDFTTKYLYINGPATIAAPLAEVALNTLEIQFDLSFESTSSCGPLYLGYTESLAGTITYVDTINAPAGYVNHAPFNYAHSFTDLDVTEPAYIILMRAGSSNYLTAIDNFAIVTASSCARATNITVSGVTDNAATISWSDPNNAGNYTVAYSTVNDLQDTATVVVNNLTSTDYSLSQLTPNTTYHIWVRVNCGAETSAWVYGGLFTTACTPSPIPYSNDFESYTSTGSSYKFDPCWNVYKSGSYYYPYVTANTSYSSYAYEGTKCLSFNSSNAYTALPLFDTNLSVLQLTFMGKTSSTSGAVLSVGVMTNPADISTYQELYQFNMTSTYQLYTAYLSAFQGNGGNIAFRATSSSSVYVDSLVVDLKPSCTAPAAIAIDQVTPSSATLTWVETGDATAWEAEYRAYGDTAWSAPIAVSATPSVSISGLAPASPYELHVRAVCSATEYSDWSDNFLFRTECSTMVLPYTEDFESYAAGSSVQPACWSDLSTGSSRPYIQNMVSGGYSSWATGNAYHIYGTNVVVTPRLPLPLNQIDIAFLLSREGESSSSLVVGFIPTLSTPIDSMVVLGTYEYTTYKHYFDEEISGVPSGIADTGYIVFKSNGSTSWYWWIDNLYIGVASSCVRVSDIEQVAATSSSITLGWTENSTATSWQIEYGPNAFSQGNGTLVVVNSNPTTISGLNSSTNYDFYIRPICSDEDTGRWSPCFNAATAMCDNATIVTLGTGTESTSYVPANTFYNYGLSEVIIGADELADMGDISAFGFFAKGTGGGNHMTNCRVFIGHTTKTQFSSSSDFINVDSSFTLVYSGSLNYVSGWNTFAFDAPFVWDGVNNVVLVVDRDHGAYEQGSGFEASTDSLTRTFYIYDDSNNPDPFNIGSYTGYNKSTSNTRVNYQLVSCGAGCAAPVLNAPTTTYESIALSWNSAHDSCEVAIVEGSGWIAPSAGTLVTSNSYTFSNLAPASAYTVGVRQICDEGSYSEWAFITVTTDSLPCFAPENLTAQSVSYRSVTLTWTPGGEETHWQVRIYNSSYDSTYAATASTASFGGLQSNVAYQAEVRAMCGSNGQLGGDWSDPITFTTANCTPVTNVAVVSADESSITLGWTAGGEEPAWNIEYSDDPDFGTGEGQSVTATSNPFQITGLDAATTYYFYVYAKCADDLVSVASSKVSGTTQNVGIEGVDGNAAISIYPNPTNDVATISISGIEGNVTVSVVDMNGRVVRSAQVAGETKLAVEGLAQGAYFVRIVGENVNSVKKLIVR